MTDYLLPIKNEPHSIQKIKLDGLEFQFDCRWNETDQSWYLNIEGIGNPVKLNGIKLVNGLDLLYPHVVMEMGGLTLIDLEGAGSDPDYDGFGSRFRLVYESK
jgi:hypothetical protein